MLWSHEIRAGTTGGTILSTLGQLNGFDLLQTIVCAFIGAVVSYFVTLLLKKLLK